MTTTVRPDIAMWSTSQKLQYILEQMVPWEAAVEEAYDLMNPMILFPSPIQHIKQEAVLIIQWIVQSDQ